MGPEEFVNEDGSPATLTPEQQTDAVAKTAAAQSAEPQEVQMLNPNVSPQYVGDDDKPLSLSPAQKLDYRKKAGFVDPLADLPPEELVKMAHDPSQKFNILSAFNARQKEMLGDPQTTHNVAAAWKLYRESKGLGDLPSPWEAAKSIGEMGYGLAKQTAEGGPAALEWLGAEAAKPAEATQPYPDFWPKPGFNGQKSTPLQIELERQMVEAGSASAVGGQGLVEQLRKFGNIPEYLAKSMGKSKLLPDFVKKEIAPPEETPQESANRLWLDSSKLDITQDALQGKNPLYLSGTAEDLAAKGAPVRPSEIETMAKGDILGVAGNLMAFKGVGAALPEMITPAELAAAGQATRNVAAGAVSGAAKAFQAVVPPVAKVLPVATAIKGGFMGGLPGVGIGYEAGVGAAKGLAKAAGAAKGVEEALPGVTGAEGALPTSSYAQFAKDVLQNLPAAAYSAGKGAMYDAAQALSADTPDDVKGVGMGTLFGLLGAGHAIGGEVLSGQLIGPRGYGEATAPTRTGLLPQFDSIHQAARDVNALPGNAARVDFLTKAAQSLPGDNSEGVYLGPQDTGAIETRTKQLLEQPTTGEGRPTPMTPEQARIQATTEVDPFAEQLVQMGYTPEQAANAASQDGGCIRNLQGHDLYYFRDVAAAPHEIAGHGWEAVLGENVMRAFDQQIQTDPKYSAGNLWDENGKRYARRMGWTDDSGESWQDAILRKTNYGKLAATEKGSPLTPEEHAAAANRYISREIYAENEDASFKHRGGYPDADNSLPARISRVIGNFMSYMGRDPLSGRVAEYSQWPLSYDLIKGVSKARTAYLAGQPVELPKTPSKAFGIGVGFPSTPAQKQQAAQDAKGLAAGAPDTPLSPGAASQKEILGTIAEAMAKESGVKLEMLSGPDQPAAAIGQDKRTRAAQIEFNRTAPQAAKSLWPKGFTPTRVMAIGKGKFQVFGYTPEVYAANMHRFAGSVSDMMAKDPAYASLSPYPIDPATRSLSDEGWKQFYQDTAIYVKNQMSGRTGFGEPLVVPRFQQEHGMWKPQEGPSAGALSEDKSQLINLLFGGTTPRTPRITGGKMPLGIAGPDVHKATMEAAGLPSRIEKPATPRAKEFSGEAAEKLGIVAPGESRPIVETNPLRNRLEEAATATGVPEPSMLSSQQRLNLENILKAEHAPEQPQFRGNTLALAAGFQPPREGNPANDLIPALRDPEGKIYPGQAGKTHADIYASQPTKMERLMLQVSEPEHGFLRGDEFLNRQQAAAHVGEKTPLQSERLRELQTPKEGQTPVVSTVDPTAQFQAPKEKEEKGPVYYSQLARVVNSKFTGAQMPADQLSAILRNPQNGIKADEMKWTGTDDFLASKGHKPVTQAEIQDHLKQNAVQVKENTRQSGGWEAIEVVVAQANATYNNAVHLSNLSRGGGEEGRRATSQQRAIWEKESETEYAHYEQMVTQLDTLRVQDDKNGAKFESYQLPGGENYREMLFTLPEDSLENRVRKFAKATDQNAEELLKNSPEKLNRLMSNSAAAEVAGTFTSPHWDEPNVLAHTRLNDRTDSAGSPGLFAEEIQSDWHQKGRKEGYAGDTAPEADEESRALQQSSEVPDAPFKTTWHELVLRRLVRMAAEEGKDWLGWTTGEQQAARYDLSKQLDKVQAYKDSDGEVTLFAFDKEGREVFRKNKLAVGDVEGYVGKDLAKKIEAQKEKRAEYSGLDLKVGGEGMKGFYDKILVDYANKFGKKFGAKVEDREIPTGETDYRGRPLTDDYGKLHGQSVHSLPITPEMKASVLKEGVAQFEPPKRNDKREQIESAAIRLPSGKIFTGPIHSLAYENAAENEGYDALKSMEESEFGFTTTHGRFVDRITASDIAKKANQLRREPSHDVGPSGESQLDTFDIRGATKREGIPLQAQAPKDKDQDFIGKITNDAVQGEQVRNAYAVGHDDFGMGGHGNRWRYDSAKKVVDWNNEPSPEDKEAVNSWLAKRGVSGEPEHTVFAQFQAPRGKDTDWKLISPGASGGGFSKAWITPEGLPIQLGGTWHHDYLNENPEVKAKYGLSGSIDAEELRQAALRRGFARVNYGINNGVMTVEARKKDWPALIPAVTKMAQANVGKLDHMEVHLFDNAVKKVIDSDATALFRLSDKEKMKNLPLISTPSGTTEMSAQASSAQYQPPPFQDKGFDKELAEIRSGKSGGATFNRDGTTWQSEKRDEHLGSLFSVNLPLGDLNRETVEKALRKHFPLLDEPNIKPGIFAFSKDGKPTVSIDLNSVVPNKHIENTKRFANQNDQVSIWDTSKGEYGEEVPTGGKGNTRLQTTDELLDAHSALQQGLPTDVNDIIKENAVKGVPGRTEILPGMGAREQNLTPAAAGRLSNAEAAEYYPESVKPKTMPRNAKGEKVDEHIPSEITNSPLYKAAGGGEEAEKAFGRKMAEFAKEWMDHPSFQSGLKWYSEFVPMLKKAFGKDHPIMAELLAGTSPNETPATNFAMAVDALDGYKAGRFNKQIAKFEAGLNMLKSNAWKAWSAKEGHGDLSEEGFLKEWVNKHDLKPRKANGKLYGISSDAVMKILARKWLENTPGLKTQNFVKNLLGIGHEATIDLWADRTMRRLGYSGFKNRWRILPKNSTAVSDADFEFSQAAFRHAAKEMHITPDALQGGLWFAEKQLWADRGYGRLDLGDYREEIKKLDMLKKGVKQSLATQKKAAKGAFEEQPDLLVTPRNLKK